jgi:predicted pyridoxine 5'-phosphate oxidase superfamily flavin-nucleotide-binding protein
MDSQFFHRMFGDRARALQVQAGSRSAYARAEASNDDAHDRLTERELGFIALRDSFYMASVTATGWPYIQHKGGPAGFLRHLGGNTLGFADREGNRQFISAGNIADDARVSLFLMDYPARRRLKLIGHARIIDADADPALARQFAGAKGVGTITLIDVIGFDWNCPKYITQRFTLDQIDRHLRQVEDENTALRAELARLKETTT